ncbi:hypothetical protein C9374_005847 [Naegleria lovaniensis]|uniref:EF-hand domain-containing protein n=1 Tax=Naegleria lovaniensis TaxID=51637 RepID=A0AA88KJY6_NAELO|nr:uncharacterized protein C9374_005847 [Naegleria lovaniensis]KAG2382055.1 hypothetical protein C9374_005847 [Naegleria lovaniensis]
MLRQTEVSIEEIESRLPPEQLEIYRKAFRMYDKNGDGVIETAEIMMVMKSLGASMNEQDLHDLLIEMGIGENVDFHAFLKIMFCSCDGGEESLRASFKLFDSDGDGFIGVEDLKEMLHKLGEDVSDAQVQQVMNMADKDKDGKISVDDFIRIMK